MVGPVILRKITARKQAEELLEQSRNRLLDQQKTLAALTRSEIFSGDSPIKTIQLLTQTSARQMEIERASFKPKTEGKIDPLKDVDVENAKLKGFNWQYDKRPKSRADLHPNFVIRPPALPTIKQETEEVPKKKKKG